ncbi:efflux RND transporter periplasmic adaptor subunit [Synechocystis sp. LKSZ1]|uniref:efflux RND transporter periplasmic adaptor subunit n=1 Tax=Synechocystis sp. LKSZ1 TaxID=3144951 RepID=UPI00336BFC1F
MFLSPLNYFKRPLPLLLGLLGVGIIAVGGFTYRLMQAPRQETELEKYTVLVQRENLAVEIKANGTVQPIQTVNISPKTPGRLVQLLVEQGDQVQQGQRLAIMENREAFADGLQAQARLEEAVARFREVEARIPRELQQLQTEVNQAQTRVAQARSQLAVSQNRLREVQARIPKDIEQLQAQLRAAESRLKLAENRMQRNQDLINAGAISRDRFDEVSNDYLNARAAVVETLGRLQQAQNTASPEVGQVQEQIQQLQAAIVEAEQALQGKLSALRQRESTAPAELASLKANAQAARANLERSKIQYQDTYITAPFSGVITQKYATAGAFVTPTTSASNTASATSSSILALASGLEIVARVPEVDIGTLKLGQKVEIQADAFPNERFQGKVIRIAPEAILENNVTSFEVTVGLVTGQDKLRSKMNVDVVFEADNLFNALTVPTVAIVTQAGKTGVMVPDAQNQPKFQPVTIGLVLDEQTQVLAGLQSGQRVFIDLPKDKRPKEKTGSN